jgi:hypothetical protein
MSKKPTIQTLSSGYNSLATINNNFLEVQSAFDNTLSRDGSIPNTMDADFDMNSNDILNAGDIGATSVTTGRLTVAGSSGVYLSPTPDWKGTWTPATAYSIHDLVYSNRSTYICVTAHTSSTFATDLSAGLWEVFAYGIPLSRYTASFSGNGAAVAFVLPLAVTGDGLVDIYISGVRQEAAAFSYLGDTITFTAAPPVGTDNIEVLVTDSDVIGYGAEGITFISDATGGRARTVASKLQDFVVLEDFGGGVGVADNSPAFQAAMNAGGRLYVPEGKRYYLKSYCKSDNRQWIL